MNRPLQNIGKKGCIPTSSKCIVWEGPALECIDICKGDTIEDIIYKVANYVCNLNLECCPITATDLANIEFTCQIPAFSDNTYFIDAHNVYEFLEQICSWIYSLYYGTSNLRETEQALTLPECLYYEENGDTIMSLLRDDYIRYLADKICEIVANYDALLLTLDDISDRLEAVEEFVENYKEPEPPELYITSQCASAASPGEEVEITEAFETFEGNYCSYITLLGLSPEWTAALNSTCTGLGNSYQLANQSAQMKTIYNWILSPSSVADNYNNLWLTICDIRAAIQDIIDNQITSPCVLAMPENLSIDSISAYQADISWEPSSLVGIADPLGYVLEVYETLNGVQIGNCLYNGSYMFGDESAAIISSSIESGKTYVVKIAAVYTCGTSNYATVYGELKDTLILFKINVTDSLEAGTTVDCTDAVYGTETFDVDNRKTTVTFVNASTNTPMINNTGVDIDVTIRYLVHTCGITGFVEDDVVITIANGDSTGEYDYESSTVANCGDGNCIELTRGMFCGVSISNINTAFGTGIYQCS
jgi:hypothetical protein